MSTATPVQLEPPGAGLPAGELFISRLLFGGYRLITSRERALQHFQTSTARIRQLAESLAPADAARPVLIDRVRGIEDSSRNWSVYMALEHLVIVDGLITATLKMLTDGRTPDRKVSTAAVKPPPVTDPAVIQRFTETTDRYGRILPGLPSLRTAVRLDHPWFGPLDAHGWHCMAAIHHEIHLQQIRRIIAGLRAVD